MNELKLYTIWMDASEHFMSVAKTQEEAIKNVRSRLADWGRDPDYPDVTHVDHYELSEGNTFIVES